MFHTSINYKSINKNFFKLLWDKKCRSCREISKMRRLLLLGVVSSVIDLC